MARRWLPDNVTAYKDRHGKTRYRFRKTGVPAHHFRNAPGTPEFMAEYLAAQQAVKLPVERWAPYTYDALIVSFYQSPRWIDSKPATQKTYRNIIERFRSKNGDKDVRRVTTANIERKLSSMRETPAAANNLRKVLARLHRHAIKLGWRQDNPVDATDSFRTGKGFHAWTESEIDAFDSRWPFGTRERLAKELLLATAQRRSDAIKIGPGNRQGDALILHHNKNDSGTVVPMGPDLIEALRTFPGGESFYLETQFGKPFSSTGFYNWFKRACVKAGIPHCSPHGLRKATSRRLAEAGATTLEGRAVTGHKTDKEFAKYAESASKRALAGKAMANVHEKFAKIPANKEVNPRED
ncbi:tyrosine-type recombinase/integrase [Novosphingobium capsulatum]|uniref:tyrosine-type recombinase/integrase n=1 Tax=Novosphingobium capsulatum TaxID=13688 RepID=UPI000787271C|nr:tyrosine-type recombinase/integrase [Novosphingobium capsulatum]WQD92582.1 tyrosine-type recombinase/integrase [Novosphingobium capsulatum]